jgi:hypothetical protein
MATGRVILTGTNTFTDPLRSTDSGNVPTFNINSDAAMGHTNNGVQAVYSMNFQTAGSTAITLAPSRSFTSYAGRTLTFDIPATSTLTVPGPVVNNGTIAKSARAHARGLHREQRRHHAQRGHLGTLRREHVQRRHDHQGRRAQHHHGRRARAGSSPPTFTAGGTLRGGAPYVSLSAERALYLTNASAYTVALDVPTDSTLAVAGTFSGNVGTNSSLSKTGTGTLILSGGTGGTQLGALGTVGGKMAITNGAWAINTASTESEDYNPFWVAGGATFEQTGGTLSLPRWVYLGVRWSADPTTNKDFDHPPQRRDTDKASRGGLLVGRKNSAVLTVSAMPF